MNIKQLIFTSFIVGLLLSITACGGGSDSSSTTTKSITGPITAFGSIYVNGDRYNTDNAAIYIEDQAGSEADLKVGMMVIVNESSHGVAGSIHFDDDLEGFVLSNSIPPGSDTGTMNVMGQTVTITTHTIFESKVTGITQVSDIATGNIVEVSGYSDNTGTINATRIEVKAVDLATYLTSHHEGVELKGIVSNHNGDDQTFNIGDLTITYAGAILDDLPNGISDGLYVEVKSIQALNSLEQLVASKVELENDGFNGIHGDEDDEVEVHGVVMSISDTLITVNNQTFQITAETEFDDISRNDLQIGDYVEVEGHFNRIGVLVAEEVEFEYGESNNIEFESAVTSITIQETNVGHITLSNGATIHINNNTIMHDCRDDGITPNQRFNLSDLQIGDFVEVYVIGNDDGTYTATKLERDDHPF